MFVNVLVPVDFTPRSEAAVEIAGRLVAADGRVILLHVVQTVPGLDLGADPAFYERLEAAASKKMNELAGRSRVEDVDWEARIVVGNRFEEIIGASEGDVDLLLVPSHRVDFSSAEKGAGTMSYRIALAAPCPVLLLK